jgi:putative membrane protein insertion efficiency factor
VTIALARYRPHFAGQTVVANVLIFLIRIYQKTLSRLLGNVCRFEPSCSRYAVACLENHGALRGSLLSAVRLCKCHPFHPGGIDLPPPKKMSL